MGTPLRVLIVEDSEDDALLLVRALRNGDYDPEFERVETATAMKTALTRHTWDIIISDYSMPRFHGSDALTIARGSRLDLPFIVLSGAIGEETAVEIMKAGAHDYIMKNNPVRLIPAIKRELYEGDVRRERRRAEEETRKFKTISDRAGYGVYIVDLEGKLIYTNETCARMHGYLPDELIGRHFSSIYPGRQVKVIQKLVDRLIQEGGHWAEEIWHKRKDGTIFLTITTALIIKDDEEKTRYIATTAIDITERKQAEEEIAHTNLRLREAMEKLQVSQAQLLQSAKMAAIGQLVSGVAHELNNPLEAVSLYSEMLPGEVNKEKIKKFARVINQETDRAINIVNNLLAFARKREPRKSYISINESLANTVELRAYDLSVNNIKGTLRLAPDLPRTMADFHQLQQVFLNLITNAEQAIKEAHGKGSLVIETRKVPEMIQITFADDGPGIPAANLDRVFEPFFTTKGIGQGTGLGLSICYGIIKEHGGRIYVESGDGGGATFVVELPVVSEIAGCPAETGKKAEHENAGGERREMVAR